MIIFIDESGDAGFQIGKGSSRTFTIAMVIFDEDKNAEAAGILLKLLKHKLRKSEQFEFKFNKSNRNFRLMFLNEISTLNFKVSAIIFNKEEINDLSLPSSNDKFYNFAIKSLLEHNSKRIQNAKIRIDSSGDKNFRKELEVYLRKSLNNSDYKIIKNIKFKDSQKDILIQLADMIAGSINRSYSYDKSDKNEYLKIIKNKIEELWEFK